MNRYGKSGNAIVARALCASMALLVLAQAAMGADSLDQSISVAAGTALAGAKSQKTIDALNDDAQKMLADYRATIAQAESLKVYIEQLETLTASQQQELESLDGQLAGIETTRRGIVPLLKRMIDTLETFQEHDLPFLLNERRVRIVELREMMDRADVTIAEKYRRVMEAWQAENKLGRTIEWYRGGLQQGENYRVVDYLRVGRVALVYRSLDGREVGFWDRDAGDWRGLPDNYRSSIKQALDVARKRAAPDLLMLPVSAAREAKSGEAAR